MELQDIQLFRPVNDEIEATHQYRKWNILGTHRYSVSSVLVYHQDITMKVNTVLKGPMTSLCDLIVDGRSLLVILTAKLAGP